MKPTALITVHKVPGFACYATIRTPRGKRLHETRIYPYGYNANAYQAAEDWAKEHGYVPASDDREDD